MRFRTLFRFLLILAVSADIADYAATQVGFERTSPLFERNPYIRLLMRWVNPYLASTIIFMITLALILASYGLLRSHLNKEPYSGSLRDVGAYLWRGNSFGSKDLLIFTSLTLYIIFTHMHLTGLYSWLRILRI